MIFLLYTGTSALIIYIYISNIQGTKKYSAVMYYQKWCHLFTVPYMWDFLAKLGPFWDNSETIWLTFMGIMYFSSISLFNTTFKENTPAQIDVDTFWIVTTPERYAFFRLDTISIQYLAFFSIRYDIDTIFWPQKRPSFWGIFGEFSANFQNFGNFQRIFGIFGIFGIIGEFWAKKDKINHWPWEYRDTRYWRFDTIFFSTCWKVRYIGIR